MGSASTERSPSRLCVPPGLSPRPLVSRAALSFTILCHPCARQAVERLLREGHERRDDDRLRRRKSAPERARASGSVAVVRPEEAQVGAHDGRLDQVSFDDLEVALHACRLEERAGPPGLGRGPTLGPEPPARLGEVVCEVDAEDADRVRCISASALASRAMQRSAYALLALWERR
jgi:hypothetical protein